MGEGRLGDHRNCNEGKETDCERKMVKMISRLFTIHAVLEKGEKRERGEGGH